MCPKENERKNKVLFVTGTPFRNDTNSGKTLGVMFDKFPSEELAQLYFSPQSPKSNACETYYQINEKQLIKSFFGINARKCGGEISSLDLAEAGVKPEKNADMLTKIGGNILIRIMRNFLWKISHWENKNYYRWLDSVSPSIIFTILFDNPKTAKAVRNIAKRYDCSVVMFVTDDNYNDSEKKPSLIRKLFYKSLQKSTARLMRDYGKYIIGCCDMASDFFGEKFRLPHSTVYTPSNAICNALPLAEQNDEGVVVFRYFGNIMLRRWESLKKLGEAIRDYNIAKGEKKAILEVYSGATHADIIEELTIENGCEFKGWISGEEYFKALQTAHIGVHVESFDENMIRRTKMSISTKIADYLGAGKCIFAIGPDEVASMQHIKDVAVCVNDASELLEKVSQIAESADLRRDYQKKAKEYGEKNHNIEKIGSAVREIVLG